MYQHRNILPNQNRIFSNPVSQKPDSIDEIPVPEVDNDWTNEEPTSYFDGEPELYPDKSVPHDFSGKSMNEISSVDENKESLTTLSTKNLPKRKITPTPQEPEPEIPPTTKAGTFDTTHKRHTIYLTYQNYNKIVALKNEGRIKNSTRAVNEALGIYLSKF